MRLSRQLVVLVGLLWYTFSVVLAVPPVLSSYRHADPVSAMRRLQYGGYVSEFQSLVGGELPRFAMDRTIRLHVGDAIRVFNMDQELKVSFSFDHDRFVTTWITIRDGRGQQLRLVEFDFYFSGDHLRSVKWATEYGNAGTGEGQPATSAVNDPENNPEDIYVRYHWHEYVETDTALGLDVVFLVAVVVSYVSAFLVICKADTFKKSGPKQS